MISVKLSDQETTQKLLKRLRKTMASQKKILLRFARNPQSIQNHYTTLKLMLNLVLGKRFHTKTFQSLTYQG